MHRIFVYGTLKRGFYNHARCSLDTQTFLGPGIISGMQMTTWQSAAGSQERTMPYPAAYIGVGEITGEIYDVSDEVFTAICTMELFAGYSIKSTESNGGRVILFFNPHLSDDSVPDYAVISTYDDHASDWYKARHPPAPLRKKRRKKLE